MSQTVENRAVPPAEEVERLDCVLRQPRLRRSGCVTSRFRRPRAPEPPR
jgi:hypothetical protein